MTILKSALQFIFGCFLLYFLTNVLDHPHEEFYNTNESYVFEKGNASEEVRSEILIQLNKFQKGYTDRDQSSLETFMTELFSKENILILGTMPQEIYSGFEQAAELVSTDWSSWGDCTFIVDNTNISANDNTVWFSTFGYVQFDLSSLLVMPLRLTGVMVKEQTSWKIQQMQFQFDLDLIFYLLTLIIVILWSLYNLVKLIIVIVRYKIKPSAQ